MRKSIQINSSFDYLQSQQQSPMSSNLGVNCIVGSVLTNTVILKQHKWLVASILFTQQCSPFVVCVSMDMNVTLSHILVPFPQILQSATLYLQYKRPEDNSMVQASDKNEFTAVYITIWQHSSPNAVLLYLKTLSLMSEVSRYGTKNGHRNPQVIISHNNVMP